MNILHILSMDLRLKPTIFENTCQSELEEGVLNIPFHCYVLTNLQFTLKFICPFIIREGAFLGDEVENLIVVTIVADLSPNQLSITHQGSYVWLALKKKIPLVFNFAVHLF